VESQAWVIVPVSLAASHMAMDEVSDGICWPGYRFAAWSERVEMFAGAAF